MCGAWKGIVPRWDEGVNTLDTLPPPPVFVQYDAQVIAWTRDSPKICTVRLVVQFVWMVGAEEGGDPGESFAKVVQGKPATPKLRRAGRSDTTAGFAEHDGDRIARILLNVYCYFKIILFEWKRSPKVERGS